MKLLNNLKLTDILEAKLLIQKTWRLKLYKEYWIKNQYQIVNINGIMFIMKNFTGQKFGIILKDWTSVIQLKNSNGNAPIALFTPKVDLERWTYPIEDVTFVKNRTFKKISNICFLNALYLTDSYQTSQF